MHRRKGKIKKQKRKQETQESLTTDPVQVIIKGLQHFTLWRLVSASPGFTLKSRHCTQRVYLHVPRDSHKKQWLLVYQEKHQGFPDIPNHHTVLFPYEQHEHPRSDFHETHKKSKWHFMTISRAEFYANLTKMYKIGQHLFYTFKQRASFILPTFTKLRSTKKQHKISVTNITQIFQEMRKLGVKIL